MKRRISERTGVEPSHLQVMTETLKQIGKGKEPSTGETILMKKIEELQKQLRKYE